MNSIHTRTGIAADRRSTATYARGLRMNVINSGRGETRHRASVRWPCRDLLRDMPRLLSAGVLRKAGVDRKTIEEAFKIASSAASGG